MVRLEPHEDQGMLRVPGRGILSARRAAEARSGRRRRKIEEEDEPQPYVEGQPTIFEPNPPPAKPKRAPARKRAPAKHAGAGAGPRRRPRPRKKTDGEFLIMAIERIFPASVPTPRGPYSPAVRAGDFIFVSGQGPVDPATDQLSPGDIQHETRLVLANIKRILESCGATVADVVKCSVFLKDGRELSK